VKKFWFMTDKKTDRDGRGVDFDLLRIDVDAEDFAAGYARAESQVPEGHKIWSWGIRIWDMPPDPNL
jgi:hypothetical protein